MAEGKLSEEIRKAVARGALTPARAGRYVAAALDNPESASAVARTVAALWGPGQIIPPDELDDPDGTMAALWPAAPPGQPHEPDRLAQLEQRLPLRAGAPGPDPEDISEGPETGPPDAEDRTEGPEHPPMLTEHTHPHSDYAGNLHDHAHVHINNSDHRPKPAVHEHQLAAAMTDPAVTAGIRRRAAEHTAAAARPNVADMTDAEVIKYMGPPPGG